MNNRKTLEYISNNIITSESLIEKIQDSSDKFSVENIRNKFFAQDLALDAYFEKYMPFLANEKFSRTGIIKPLRPKRLTFIYKGYDFLTSPSDSLILMRSSINREFEMSQKNLLESINSILHEEETRLTLTDILEEFSKTQFLDASDIESYIEGEIPRANYKQVGKKNIIDDTTLQRTYKFLSKIVNILSEKLNLNILFILPSIVSVDSKSNKTLILSDLLEDRATIGMVIFIPTLHQHMIYKSTKIPDNRIFFDNIFELDYENNRISSYIGKKITKNIIIENGLTLSNKIFKNPIKNEKIQFEPLDRYEELQVVEISGPDNLQRRYLLGIFGNLYEDDDKFNDLVGRIEAMDVSSGKGKVYWCKKYYEELKK